MTFLILCIGVGAFLMGWHLAVPAISIRIRALRAVLLLSVAFAGMFASIDMFGVGLGLPAVLLPWPRAILMMLSVGAMGAMVAHTLIQSSRNSP